MSVIVMGMEMPGTCAECRISIEVGSDMHCPLFAGDIPQDFGRKADCGFERSPDWCPLRPLPDKHGRLVDIDAIIAELKDEDAESGVKASGADLVVAILLAYLDSKPTIVEAEGD